MNDAPFGALAPNPFDRAIMALTGRMPDNWAGLKLAMALRRLVTMRMETAAALDVERWRLRMRLHPRDNGCEKNLLFTPQMYEPQEREELVREIARVSGRRVRVRRHRRQCRAVLAVRRGHGACRPHPRHRAGARQFRAARLQHRGQSRAADHAARARTRRNRGHRRHHAQCPRPRRHPHGGGGPGGRTQAAGLVAGTRRAGSR